MGLDVGMKFLSKQLGDNEVISNRSAGNKIHMIGQPYKAELYIKLILVFATLLLEACLVCLISSLSSHTTS